MLDKHGVVGSGKPADRPDHDVDDPFTTRKYTFNIDYLEHSTSVLKPMLKVTMLNV